jgi:hypothetical protein
MKSGLTKLDYIKILKFYHIKLPKTTAKMKELANNIMASKLCKCVKNINTPNNIASCTNSIFKFKGLTRGNFKCTKNKTVRFTKQKINI